MRCVVRFPLCSKYALSVLCVVATVALMVGPDCRIFLDKYDGILEIIRLGIIEAGHNPEEFTAFVERTPACSRSSRSLAGSRV